MKRVIILEVEIPDEQKFPEISRSLDTITHYLGWKSLFTANCPSREEAIRSLESKR
jgi:hypothetical protein